MQILPDPVDHECLPCYLYRVGAVVACDGSLRALKRYRDCVAPRASALERKVMALGGYCDCEVLMNAMRPATTETMRAIDRGEDLVCHGVRLNCAQPCDRWAMRRGVQWGGGRFRTSAAKRG